MAQIGKWICWQIEAWYKEWVRYNEKKKENKAM